jgi:pilus assembly protein TadC
VRRLVLRRGDRQESASAEVADALVLLALALRAGIALTDAIEQVQHCSEGSVRQELAATAAALRWGRPAAQAWVFAGSRWEVAALAWRMAEDTGASPATMVRQAAARLREEQERDGERRAARAGVMLVLPLGLGFLPAFACTAVVPIVIVLAGRVFQR